MGGAVPHEQLQRRRAVRLHAAAGLRDEHARGVYCPHGIVQQPLQRRELSAWETWAAQQLLRGRAAALDERSRGRRWRLTFRSLHSISIHVLDLLILSSMYSSTAATSRFSSAQAATKRFRPAGRMRSDCMLAEIRESWLDVASQGNGARELLLLLHEERTICPVLQVAVRALWWFTTAGLPPWLAAAGAAGPGFRIV